MPTINNSSNNPSPPDINEGLSSPSPDKEEQFDSGSSPNRLYTDKTRPTLVEKAEHLLSSGVKKLTLNSIETTLEHLCSLIQKTPLLKHSPEKSRALFHHPTAPNHEANPLEDSVDRLLQKPAFAEVKKSAFDDNAFVFNKGVTSEPEQIRLVKATIESADKFAAITTYSIKPLEENGKVSNTMHGVLAGVAEKQNDPEFNFVFLYNKSKGFQNMVTGNKRTQVSINPENSKQPQWPEVLDAYNKQIVDEYNKAVESDAISGKKMSTAAEFENLTQAKLQTLVNSGHISGLPITDLKAKVYMVAADPGLGGSHHNKFCINDSGLAATLGASIGNKSKPSWFDSGAVTLSQKLASSQRNYLLDTLIPEGEHIGLLKLSDGKSGIDAAITKKQVKSVREKLDSDIRPIEIKDPLIGDDEKQLNDKLEYGLRSSGFLKEDEGVHGHYSKVACIQNKGSNLEPRDAKPIKQALEHLFKEAKAGDTILLRNCVFNSTAQKLVFKAISSGVNVKVLAPTRTKLNDAALLFKEIQGVKNKVDRLSPDSGAGKLEVHVFNPNQDIRDAHDFDPGGRPINDHAKVYALKRKDPQESTILLTGTHNLDGQSFKRSHENVFYIESKDKNLTDSLFDDFWDGTPEMTKQDIDLLVTKFKKPRDIPKTEWVVKITQKEALLKKAGL